MLRKISFGLIWSSLLIYAFVFAPPNDPGTFELIKNLSLGKWEGINPLVISLFNLMGILPIIYTCLMLSDGRGQKIRAWIFASASFAVGAFAILPYLALREPNPKFTGEKDLLLRILDSRWLGIILSVATGFFVTFGLSQGNWSDFIQQWQTSRFINVMSLDFCCLTLLIPSFLGDDLARRGIKNPLVFWGIALVPLLSSLVYLCLRPPLLEIDAQ
jgi:hypothetical protein